MKIIEINAKEQTYPVYIGNCLDTLTNYLGNKAEVLVITDDIVKEYHFASLLPYLGKVNYHLFSLGNDAESSKNLSSYQRCLDYCLTNYFTRNLTVLAFGGGAVGDFAAFFASTYKRGVPLINIPTTILAHDSSVGGKTALNFNEMKNALGTFYQPIAVLYHLDFLKTLKTDDILSGFGEVIKHDLLGDGHLLSNLINNQDLKTITLSQQLMEEILFEAIMVKKSYIEFDIYDTLGKRQFLNLGHTFAHAIERLYHFSHGEAVSLGICFDLFLANNHKAVQLYDWFKKQGYFKKMDDFDIEKITEIIKNDKKNTNNLLKFIGLKEIGHPFEINLTIRQFIEAYKQFVEKVIR